jgi:asparagine synthase (glutamine-hydrolysing)
MAMRDDVIRLYDEPFADSSAVPTFYVSQLARSKVKVALSGEGGDELFGGYTWYSIATRLKRFDAVPMSARRLAATVWGISPRRIRGDWMVRMSALDPIERYTKLVGGLLRSEKEGRLSKQFTRQFEGYDDYWYLRQYWREDLDDWSRMQYLDMKTYLNDDILTKVDRASMAVSLEARVPLLDHELIETVLTIPTATRNRGFEKKYLFKKAMCDLLPSPLLTRSKRGFSIPLYEWLKAPTLDDLGPLYDGMFDVDRILGGRDAMTGADIWPVIVMNRWLRAYA